MFEKAIYDAIPMLQMLDDLYYWCYKMQRVGGTDSWVPREGYTIEDNLRLMKQFPRGGTHEEMRALIEKAKREE